MAILAGLQAAYPHPEQPEHAALHELLGATNDRIIERAVALLHEGDAQQLGAPSLAARCADRRPSRSSTPLVLGVTRSYLRPGALMTEAQSLFDKAAGPCCPHQLASPVLHRVLQYGAVAEHVWGGKGVGSQVPTRDHDLCQTEQSRQQLPKTCRCLAKNQRANLASGAAGRRCCAAALSQPGKSGSRLQDTDGRAQPALYAPDASANSRIQRSYRLTLVICLLDWTTRRLAAHLMGAGETGTPRRRQRSDGTRSPPLIES